MRSISWLVVLSLTLIWSLISQIEGQTEIRVQMGVNDTTVIRVEDERNATHAIILPTILRILNASSTTYDESRVIPGAPLSNTRLSDLENDNSTIQMQQRYRARKKQERLFIIQAQILQRLQVTPTRSTNLTSPLFSQEERQRMAQIFERMRQLRHQNHGSDVERSNQIYAERFQSFYPSCQLPNNTDRSLWESPGTMRLYYSIIFPRPSQTTETNILSSKLRLYKFQSPESQQSNCVDCGGIPSSFPSFLIPTPTLTVSVYYFLKPLKQNRKEKKRYVDSRIISADLEGWIELNIAPSVLHWYQNRHKNYGVDIEVEDHTGAKLDPNLYFRAMNCSENASLREPPFPNLLEIHPDMAENESSLFDNETYPTLDLQTTEFSREQTPGSLVNHRTGHRASGQEHFSTNQAPAVDSRAIRKRHAGTVYLRPAWYRVCRHKRIFVTYKDLGLEDMALDPEGGFSVGYCSGSCLEDDHRTHQDLERRDCVPTSFRPLHLEYMDEEGDASELILHDISAKTCACAA